MDLSKVILFCLGLLSMQNASQYFYFFQFFEEVKIANFVTKSDLGIISLEKKILWNSLL